MTEKQMTEKAYGKPGQLLAVLAVAFACLGASAGCCTCKGLFGVTTYYLSVIAQKDANMGGSPQVLVVWPSPDTEKDFRDAKSIDDARKELDRMTLHDDYEAYDLKTIEIPTEMFFREQILDGRRATLHRQCDARRVFVFTTLPGKKIVEQPLVSNRGEFGGYLTIELGPEDADVHFRRFEIDEKSQEEPR